MSDAIGEAITSFKDTIKERALSPLSGAFIISWLIINYRIFFILLTDDYPLRIKFKILDEKYSHEKINQFSDIFSSSFLHSDFMAYGFFYPLAGAAFFIIIYPMFANIAYGVWELWQRVNKEIQVRIEAEKPLTREESRKTKRENSQLRTRVKELEDIERETKADLDQVTKEYNDIHDSYTQLKDKNSDLENRTMSIKPGTVWDVPADNDDSSNVPQDVNQESEFQILAESPTTSTHPSEVDRYDDMIEGLTGSMISILNDLFKRGGHDEKVNVRNSIGSTTGPKKVQFDSDISKLKKKELIDGVSDIYLTDKGRDLTLYMHNSQ